MKAIVFLLLAGLFVVTKVPAQTDVTIHQLGYGYINMYAVRSGDKWLLIDTGLKGKEHKIERQLKRLGVEPSALSLIILTHGHNDHAGGAKYFQQKYKIPVLIHEGDLSMAVNGHDDSLKIATPKEGLARLVMRRLDNSYPAFQPDVVINNTFSLQSYGFNGQILHTPGHTTGSVTVAFGNQAIVADVIRGSVLLRRRPQFHFYASDLKTLQKTWAFLLKQPFAQWYVGHGGPLTPAQVQRFLDKNRQQIEKMETLAVSK